MPNTLSLVFLFSGLFVSVLLITLSIIELLYNKRTLNI